MKKILTVSGIGDIHWVMLKMESWIKKNCPNEKPEIYIWDFDGRRRSEDYVKRVPFVKFGGYFEHDLASEKKKFNAAYIHGIFSEEKKYLGFDSFICVNGELRNGKQMPDILPQYDINWDYEMDLSGLDKPLIDEPYIIFYFSDHGMFNRWVSAMPPTKIKEFLRSIKGYRLILTGSKWDSDFNKLLEDEGIENWCGDTSLDELLNLMKHASAFVGWCGGNTIISQHIGTPTLMLWSEYFEKQFQTNWVKPEKIGSTYIPLNVEQLTLNKFTESLEKLLETKAAMAKKLGNRVLPSGSKPIRQTVLGKIPKLQKD